METEGWVEAVVERVLRRWAAESWRGRERAGEG